MSFDPKKHLIFLKGKEYLPVSARLIWFRQDHPDWSIITTPVELNMEKHYAIFSTSILNTEGKVIATGTKMETVKDFGDYLEKAETGSVGRALAMCGYGTQFAPELQEGVRTVDSPQGFRSAPPRPVGNNGGNRPGFVRQFNGNGGGNAPSDARPPMPMTAPEEENPFDDAAVAPPVQRERNVPMSRPNPSQEPSSPRLQSSEPTRQVAVPSAPEHTARVVRVREPEPDYADPGGSDEPESPDDDLFPEEPTPPQRRPEPMQMPSVPLGSDKPNPLAGLPVCEFPGCTIKLSTPGQLTLSMQKYGKPLCVLHQKESANLAGSRNSNAL